MCKNETLEEAKEENRGSGGGIRKSPGHDKQTKAPFVWPEMTVPSGHLTRGINNARKEKPK